MTRQTANWFHERCGELFTQSETPFDRHELVSVINDDVDPIQQVIVDGTRYYGIISYTEHNGWYEYTRWDDAVGEQPIGVCAQCVHESDTTSEVARTVGDETTTIKSKMVVHYEQAHSAVDRDQVAVETGATLLGGTTVDGNEAIHVGMDGDGSGVDADFLRGSVALEPGQYYSYTDSTAGEIQTQFASPSGGPTGLGVDSTDSLWHADNGADSIYQLTQSGSVLSQFASPSSTPQGLGVDSTDSLWHTDYTAKSIYQLTQSGSVLSQFAPPSGGPTGLGVDSTDSLWNADTGADSIYQLNQSGSVLSQFASPSGGPTGLGVDSTDSLWHADTAADSIYQLTQSGSVLSQFASPSSTPQGLGVDSTDSLWNADTAADSIYQLTAKTSIQFE